MDAHLDLVAYLADPMGALAAARGHGAVTTDDGSVIVVDHAEVRALLADPRLEVCFSEVLAALGVASGPFHDWMARSPLDHEGEDHRRWRAFMNRTFTPGRVAQVRPFLAREADRLVGRLAEVGEVELMADFADVLPALGLCELIGVPAEDRDRFTALAHAIGYGFRPLLLLEHLPEVDDAVDGLIAYAGELLEARRRDPRDDLVTHLATTGADAGYDDLEVASFLAGLVFAGNDTTRNQIGWMVATLLEAPALWDAIGTGAWPVDDAVEELLRHRSAVTAVARRAREDLVVGDATITAGTRVMLSVWGADSDPAAFAHPEAPTPGGNGDAPHLAFGHGPHHCLGAALARAELQESLRALCAGLAVPGGRGPIEWSLPIGINGPTSLPLQVSARRPTGT